MTRPYYYRRYKFKLIDDNQGISIHPGYNTWAMIIKRCYKSYHKDYKNYGGRNIYVCEEWKNGPIEFLFWFEKNWIKGLTIDRIDNDGPYSPKNCRFASLKTQNENKRQRIGIGITYIKSNNRYILRQTVNKDRLYLGCFKTYEEAEVAKYNFLKQVKNG